MDNIINPEKEDWRLSGYGQNQEELQSTEALNLISRSQYGKSAWRYPPLKIFYGELRASAEDAIEKQALRGEKAKHENCLRGQDERHDPEQAVPGSFL